MTIIAANYDFGIPARDSLLITLTEMISHAITAEEPIKAADLAHELLETVEGSIEALDDDCSVLYRD